MECGLRIAEYRSVYRSIHPESIPHSPRSTSHSAFRNPHSTGAALVVALAVMTILLAIGLTFFTVSRLQLKTSTNVENTVRADLLANAATSIAINALKQDKILNPTATSLDHLWRSRFNGSWIVGKQWAYPGLRAMEEGELPGNVALFENNWLPKVYYHDQDLQDGVAYTKNFGDPLDDGRDGLMDHLYVPRREDGFVFNRGRRLRSRQQPLRRSSRIRPHAQPDRRILRCRQRRRRHRRLRVDTPRRQLRLRLHLR